MTTLGNVTNDPTKGLGETMLDTTMVGAIAAPLKSEVLLVADSDEDTLLQSLQYVLDRPQTTRPLVFSSSWIYTELSLNGHHVTQEEADTYEKVSAALAAAGTTVVFSSGDDGLDSLTGDNQCIVNGPSPMFPSSPSILVVGATAGFPQQAVQKGDASLGNFWSGAGWSKLYRRPRYQIAVGDPYVQSLSANQTQYVNTSGRILVDVSAYGSNIAVVLQGQVIQIWGTSASAPLFASTLALVNSARRTQGKGSVGYVHEHLYTSGLSSGALIDVTKGTTCGCPDIPNLCFDCQPGYDPATGLGWPYLSGLLKLFT